MIYKNIEHISIYINKTNEIKFKIDNIDLFPNLKSFGIYSDYKSNIRPKIRLENKLKDLNKIESFYLEFLNIDLLPESLCELNSLKWLIIYYSDLKYIPNNVGNLNSLEVLNLEGTNLESIPSSIIHNRSIKYSSCEPYLMNTEIMEWINNQNLEKFDEKTYKKSNFFNFPMVGLLVTKLDAMPLMRYFQ